MKDRMIREKAYLLANGVNSHDFDTRLNQYEAIRQDIIHDKFTSLDDLKKAYPDVIDSKTSMIDKLFHSKKRTLEKAFKEVKGKIETYEVREEAIREIDAEMKKLQQEAASKYKALEQLDQEAIKDPAKEKQLREEVTKITNEYNQKMNQLNAKT